MLRLEAHCRWFAQQLGLVQPQQGWASLTETRPVSTLKFSIDRWPALWKGIAKTPYRLTTTAIWVTHSGLMRGKKSPRLGGADALKLALTLGNR